MKKCLSLIVVFALILTTLAMPMTASAYEASLLTVSEDVITVGFAAKLNGEAITAKNPAHPGDMITVDIIAKAPNADITVNDIMLDITYEASALDYVSGNSDAFEDIRDGLVSYMSYNINATNSSVVISANETGTTIGSMTFKVLDSLTLSDAQLSFDDTFGQMFYYDSLGSITEYATQGTPEKVYFTANTAVAKVGTDPLANKTYIIPEGESLDITIEGTNIDDITLTHNGAAVEGIDKNTREISRNEEGEYVLTISLVGAAEDVVYTFNLMVGVVNAELSISVPEIQEDGYFYTADEENAQTITAPVVISGLEEGVKAAIVTFYVDYDETKLALDLDSLGDNVTYEEATNDEDNYDYLIKYGAIETETPLVNGDTVAELNFSILADATVGKTDITLVGNPEIALATDQIFTGDTSISYTTAKTTVTIVPAEGADYATVTYPDAEETGWAQSYEITVDTPDGAESRYTAIAVDGSLGEPKDIFNGLTPIEDGSFTATEEKNYYVVTKIGDLYQVVEIVNGTDIKVDVTKPVIDVEKLPHMTTWMSTLDKTQTISIDGIASDANGIDAYSLGEIGDAEATLEGTTITFAANKTFNGEIEVTAIDEAGNVSDVATITIKVDGVVPTVGDITVDNDADVDENGYKTLTVEITDDTDVKSVKWYKTSVEGEGSDSATSSENIYTYEVKDAGTYIVVATDNAGNTTEKSVPVTFSYATITDINVSVVKGTEPTQPKFYTDAEMAAMGFKNKAGDTITSNGSFTYVKIVPVQPEDANYETVMFLGESGDALGTLELNNTDNTGDYTLKVVTRHKVNHNDKQEETYLFSIVAVENMPSVNADKRFNMSDYAYIRGMMMDKEGSSYLPDNTDEFYGGIYSGDVDGSFDYTIDDLMSIIESLKAGNRRPEDYTFPIYNKAAVQEPAGE